MWDTTDLNLLPNSLMASELVVRLVALTYLVVVKILVVVGKSPHSFSSPHSNIFHLNEICLLLKKMSLFFCDCFNLWRVFVFLREYDIMQISFLDA
jgi:hypothetical protein